MARRPDLACPLIADRTGNVLMKWYSVLEWLFVTQSVA